MIKTRGRCGSSGTCTKAGSGSSADGKSMALCWAASGTIRIPDRNRAERFINLDKVVDPFVATSFFRPFGASYFCSYTQGLRHWAAFLRRFAAILLGEIRRY